METLEKRQVKNEELVMGLNNFLADLHVHYQNLRGLHWNVKGKMFFLLHEKYEEYYNQTSDIIDEVAERILMIGGQPVHSFSEYLSSSVLPEVKNVSDGPESVKLVIDHSELLLEKAQNLLELSSDTNDEGTNAMLSEFIGESEKRIWMLKALLS